MEIRNKNRLHAAGMLLLLVVAFLSAYLATEMITHPLSEVRELFHAGMDVLGCFVCAVLYYGCMGEKNSGWICPHGILYG